MNRLTLTITALISAALTLTVFAQQPIAKGLWTNKDGKPYSVNFQYGTNLTARDIESLAACESLTEIVMGYAAIDSEYVTIERDLLPLAGLKELQTLHFCIDKVEDRFLNFIPMLPNIRVLEFNADNGRDDRPMCTDQCADFIKEAKTLRELVIYDGRFSDKFIEKITRGLPDLEKLTIRSPQLTDESLRFIADRCKKLKSLSIASDRVTTEGISVLDKLPKLEELSVWSGLRQLALREISR
jgi:hypothetical protein